MCAFSLICICFSVYWLLEVELLLLSNTWGSGVKTTLVRVCGRKSTIKIVILSPPIPCVDCGLVLIIVSSISIPISVNDFSLIRSRTYSAAFSFDKQSHIPSQPNIKNSSSSVNWILAKVGKRQCEIDSIQLAPITNKYTSTSNILTVWCQVRL